MKPSPSRRGRIVHGGDDRKSRKDDDDDDDGEDNVDDEEERQSLRTRRTPSRRATRKNIVYNESQLEQQQHDNDNSSSSNVSEEEEEEEEDDDDDDDVPIANLKSKTTTKTKTDKTSFTAKTDKKKLTKKDLTCPHCQRVFSILPGLRYHIDNYVCRKDEKPVDKNADSATKTSRKRKARAAIPQHNKDSTDKEEDKEEPSKDDNHDSDKNSTKEEGDEEQEEESSTESSNDDDDDDDNDSSDESFVEAKPTIRRKRRRTLSSASPSSPPNANNNPKKETTTAAARRTLPTKHKASDTKSLSCPDCQKTFTSELGLKYHVDKQVCRREKQQKVKTTKPKKRRRRSKHDHNEDDNDDDDDDEQQKWKGVNKATKWKRFRGAKEDRTCPKCKRVFTSVLGKDYHCLNRVCEQGLTKIKTNADETPFATLEPGTEFVTRWGLVVRVVQDDRATSTATLPPDMAPRLRLWKTQKARLDLRRKDQYRAVTVHSLARRKRLGTLYNQQQRQQQQQQQQLQQSNTSTGRSNVAQDIWDAYHGTNTNPRNITGNNVYPARNFPQVVGEVLLPSHHQNPLEPEGSHPDRLVECVVIQDRRTIFDCTLNDEQEFVQEERQDVPENSKGPSMKLYLQRRELKDCYNEDSLRFCCTDCGRSFASVVGAKYHVTQSCNSNNNSSSSNKSAKHTIEDPTFIETLDYRAEKLIERQETPLLPAGGTYVEHRLADWERRTSLVTASAPTSISTTLDEATKLEIRRAKDRQKKRLWKPKKKRELAFYPQVWRSLGFKVVPRINNLAGRVSYFDKKKGEKVIFNPLSAENIEEAKMLDDTILSFKEELFTLRDKELGAFYPQVWKALRFRKPSKTPFFVLPPPRPPPPEGKEETEERPASPEPFVPKLIPYGKPPVIIDVSVLAGEIDAGRFPSMKRNPVNSSVDGNGSGTESVDHDDACCLCKDTRGILYMCDFCKNVNHLQCIRTRFIIKDPEPHDDFMCNKCIQYILTQRRRAEKRRLKSSQSSQPEHPSNHVQASAAAISQQPADGPPVPGQEFDSLAKEALHIDEILELLRDSQSRLQQLVETAKINDFRRRQFMDI